MKKFLLLTALLIAGMIGVQRVQALNFEDAINDSKPMALLVYANWADDINVVFQDVRSMEQSYGNSYNFVYMNIANEDTKAFNKKYHIYPNLPYLLLFKDRGKISRYLQKDCLMNASCFEEKLKFFLN